MKFKGIITLVAAVIVLGGAFLASGWLTGQKENSEIAVPKKNPRLVQTRVVEYETVKSAIEVPGRLSSGRIVDVISEAQGEILPGDISLKVGENFNKGQMICRIYDTEQILSIKASKSRLLNSLASALADIKFDYPDKFDDMEAFFESIKIDEPMPDIPDIEDKSLKIFLASRDILNQYYTIKGMEERLDKHYIRAPFNGSVMEVYLEAGGIANMGTRIAKIIKTDVLELEVPVEVDDLQWVKIGDEVEVLNEALSHTWKGTVARISQFIDPDTQSANVFVKIKNNKDYPIYTGMFLIARFDEKEIINAMEIPRQAVFNQNEIFFVQDSALRKQTIQIQKINNNTLIFNGLDEGLEIVVEPLINVKEGTIVSTNRI